MEKYDLVVIGAGPGGYPAAIRAAQMGASVAIVEKEAFGGVCLNWGCIPTKTLIASADLYWHAHHARSLGVNAENCSFDYAAAVKHKNRVVDKLRTGVIQLLQANGIQMFEGAASFMTRNRLAIQRRGNGSVVLEAARVIIATGSTTTIPGALPETDAVVDSRAFLDRSTLPSRLVVLGGGTIGCELACMAARFGAAVTIVELLDDILLTLDADLRAVVRRHMESALKIRILTGNPLEKAIAGQGGISFRVAGEKIEAELLLAAVGRRPFTDGLDLEKTGLKPDKKGCLEVNSAGQTKVAGIYAVGDVNGGPQLAHAATAQGLVAAEHAVKPRLIPYRQIVPYCFFTSPEIATAGLSEHEARQQNRAVKVGKFHFSALGRALASDEAIGFVKWIADAATDQLVGAAVVGAHATELLATAVTALQAELTAAEFARTIQAHPTFAEAWMEAAHAVHSRCIHAPPRRKHVEREAQGAER